MIKKGIAVAAILAGTSGLAFAGGIEVTPAPAYVGGFYLGAGYSRDAARTKWQFDDEQLTTSNGAGTTNTQRRIDAGATGWDGQLMFGYGHVWDNEYYLGAEIWGDYSNASGMQFDSISQTPASYSRTTSNFTAPWTVGIAVIPGYYVAPGSLLYVRFAYLETEMNVFNNIAGSPIPASEFPRATWHTWQSGFQFGVGTDTQVGRHISVREEYVWETYDRTSRTILSAPDTDTGMRLQRTTGVDPTMENFNLALIYSFAAQGDAPDLTATPEHTGGHFYAGLAGSRDLIFTTAQYFHNRVGPPLGPTNQHATQGGFMALDGWNVQGLFGYGCNLTNRWYAGLEIFGDWTSADGKFRLTNPGGTVDHNKLERQWSYGIAVTPGYQVSDHALLYTRIGFISGYFKTSSNTPLIAELNHSRSRWLAGVQLGVGVDTLVYNNLSLRTEFDFNKYGRFRSMSPVVDGNTTDEANYKDICEDQFNVALIWHFFGA